MKTKIVFALVFLFLVSCQKEVKETDIQNLSGYWEIEHVILPDGETKEYKANETFDFFEVNDKKGIRKKGIQQYDGTFLTNDVSEDFTIELKDGSCFINYKTDFSQWKEEIISISKEKLIVKNNNDLEYHYKRPVLFDKN